MGSFSIWHWLIVLAIVLVLFGSRGRVSSLMGDLGKGLKSFKKNMRDEAGDTPAAETGTKRIASDDKGAATPQGAKDKVANG